MPVSAPAKPPTDDTASLEAGLDALESPASASRGSAATRVLKSLLPPLVAILALLAVWTLAALAELKPSYLLPSPADVWQSLLDTIERGVFWQIVFNSLRRAIVGFGISVVAGTVLGLLMARFQPVRKGIGPLVTGLQILPSVAWVPAAILWFQISNAAMLFVVIMGATPSIANGLVSGVSQIPSLYPKVGKVLGARGFDQIRFVVLPAALPGYVAGLRQGWAFAWRSLMAAELIAFSPALGIGLGQFLDQGRQLTDMSMVMLAIVMILAVGILIELCFFAPLERRILRQRGLVGTGR